MQQRWVEIAPGRLAHASGALWLPESRTALIADLHLGYAWAQRRRGELGPMIEGGASAKLEALLAELDPAELVILGDLVHAPKPDSGEREAIEATVRRAADRVRLTLVPGNHDRGFLRDFPDLPLTVTEQWQGPGLLALHGHREAAAARGIHLVTGHLHPACTILDDAGAAHKIPAFVAARRATILPAFSPFAAGTTLSMVLRPPVRKILGPGIRIIAVTGQRAVLIPRERCCP
jgi:metallophosphoesterase superfamily enzyme